MSETYWRIHWDWDKYPFTAENAYSYLGGLPPLPDDITRFECVACDGSGKYHDSQPCESCDGEGSREAERGYSCCTSPGGLMDYVENWAVTDPGARVVEFEGDQAGYGTDGEPLVIPSRTIRVLTVDEFRKNQGT